MKMRLMTSAGIAAAMALNACAKESTTDATSATLEESTAAETADASDGAIETAVGDAEDADIDAEAAAAKIAATAAENLAVAKAFLAENESRENVLKTASGLQYEIVQKGDQEDAVQPEETDLVEVHYVGTLIDGTEFDSSRARGETAKFPLNRVIPAWTEGLQLMSEGDRFKLFVPPELGYGAAGAGERIGPNSALVFDVELIKVTSPARNLAAATAFLAENAKKEGVQQTESGLQYQVIEKGSQNDAESPSATDTVEVHYVGTLTDGAEFDSSRARGKPAKFPLNRVIPGWTEGLQLMKAGDRYRFFVPPALGYGERGSGENIGPNEALIFDVELLSVANPERNLTATTAFLEENAKKDGVSVTETGLHYKSLKDGPADGEKVTETSRAKFNFEMRSVSGELIGGGIENGRPVTASPRTIPIPGWREALLQMRVGDYYTFVLPPELAFGAAGSGPVGPNEAVIVEIEVLEIVKPPQRAAPAAEGAENPEEETPANPGEE